MAAQRGQRVTNGMPILETERLSLRQLETDDLDGLAEVLTDPVAMRFYPSPLNRDQVAAWIGRAHESYANHGFGLWAVTRRADRRFLGDCGPMLQPIEDRLIPEIGYHIVPSAQGQGYATEAARACLAWLFERGQFDMACSLVVPENAPSRAVASKVHQSMREIVWGRLERVMCMYWSTSDVGQRNATSLG
jgi:RimJ/RimL family protein N-acetyltransferase